jgi:hypothetical protein
MADLGEDLMGVIVTGSPDHGTYDGAPSRVSLDELFRDVRPIASVEELAAPEALESDSELDEFLVAVRADRDADLA